MHQYLEKRLEGIRQVLIAQHNAGISMSSASKGFEREIFISEFLSKAFPPNTRFGSGDIIDSYGNATGQIDVVVELPFHPSFPLAAAGAVRLYMAEGIAAALEIKSDLRKEWKQIESTVRRVKSLKRRYKQLSDTIPTFAIGYKGYKTLQGLKNRLQRTDDSCRPDGILVLEDPALFIYNRSYRRKVEASGVQALYGLIAEISFECIGWSSQQPNFEAYL